MPARPIVYHATSIVQNYMENDGPLAVSLGLTIIDADSTVMVGAIVKFMTGYQLGADVLAFVNQSGISGSWDAATGTLTLTGSATLAQYQAALRTVTYQNTSDNPTAGTRLIGFAVDDGQGYLNPLVPIPAIVNVKTVNDAPQVTTDPTLIYANFGATAVLDPGLLLVDPDSNVARATVQITGNYASGQDVLGFTNTAKITGSFNASNGTLTLTGVATAAEYQAALRTVTFTNTSGTPSLATRTVQVQAIDTIGNAASNVGSLSIIFAAPPEITTSGTPKSFTENGAAITLESGLTVADIDDPNLTGGTVSITSGFASGDVLTFSNTANVSGSYNAATGVLTVTGTAAVAEYQTFLRSVQFQTNSDNPGPSRTITWVVNDGTDNSIPRTTTVNVTEINDAPVIAVGATLNYTENDPATVIAPAATLSDVDSPNFSGGSLTVSFTANGTSADQLAVRNEGSGAGQIGVSGATISYGGVAIGTASGGTSGADLVISFTSTAATTAAVQALMRNITFANTADNPSTLARTVGFTVVDGDGGTDSAAASATVNVAAVNDAPTATASVGTTAYSEGGSAVAIDGGLTVTDLDDTNLESATVSITGNFQAGDMLAFSDTAQITGSYNAGTGVLTLTGTATLAQYQAALRTVGFSSTNNNPAASKTITWVVNDGTDSSAPVTKTVAITGVNDAPDLTITDTLNYTENDPASVIAPTAAVSDSDSPDFNGGSLTVSFSANGTTDDQLAVRNQGNGAGQIGVSGANVTYGGITIGTVSGGSNGTDLVITFTAGAATPAAAQALLRNITFSNSSDNPSTLARTVVFTMVDGDGGTDTATANVSINVAGTNDAPVLSTSGGSTAYAEGDAGVAIDTGLTVSDLDDTNLESATVSVTGNFQAGDTLAFTNTPEITGSYNAGTGVLTLTGTATLAQYQAALRSVAFSTTNDNPASSKTITWVVNDGDDNSLSATKNVAITPVNDAPQLSSGATLSYTENDPASPISPAATVTDADSTDFNGGSLTASFTANGTAADQLAVRNEGSGAGQIGVSGANITYGGTTIGTFSGGTNGTDLVITFTSSAATPAAVQALVRNITFANTSENPSTLARTVSFTVVDGDGGTDSASASATVNVAAVNDAPTVTTSGGSTAYSEGGAAVAIDGALTLADPDSATFSSATVQVTAGYISGEDVLEFTNTAGMGNIAASFNAGTGTLTLTSAGATATPAEWQAALRAVTFDSTSTSPGASRTISFQVNDGAGANNLSLVATKSIAVTEVNSPPVVATTGGSAAFTEGGGAVTVDSGVSVSDPDSASLTGATVTITTGFNSGQDALSFTPVGAITGSYNATTGVLTLSGSGTLAQYQTALASVQYNNTSDAPTTATRTIEFQVNDGQSLSNLSTIVSRTVTVAGTNDAPVVTAGGTLAYTEGEAATAIDAAATVADIDSADFNGGSLTVGFGATGTAADQLGILTQGQISTSGANVLFAGNTIGTFSGGANGANLVISFNSAFATPAAVQALMRSISFANTSNNPSTTDRTVSFTLVDGDGGTDTGTANATVQVASVNSAPVLAAAGLTPLSYVEDAPAVTVDSGITLSDVDTDSMTGATVTISSNYASGQDVLAFTALGSITGSFNSATGVLTLSGTDTVANYQTALRSVTYVNTSQDPSEALRGISFQVNDGSALDNLSNVVSRDVQVTAVNDAPTIVAGGTVSFTENDPATVIRSTLTVSDAEGDSLTGATVTISANYVNGEDVLSFTPSGGITGSFDAATGVLTLSGTATAADYQTVLRTVTYGNASENPSTAARTVTFAATDSNGDTSTGVTTTVNVTNVNDAPVVVVPANSAVGTAFSNTNLLISGVSVSDVDAGGGNIQTVVTATNGGVTFNLAGGAGASGNGTGSVTLTGTVAQVNAALATLTFKSNDGFTGSSTISVLTNDLGSTGGGGAQQSNGGVAQTFQVGVVPQVFIIDNNNGTADDANAGTSANPFNSIANFNSFAADGTGDYIYIRNGTGTYSEANGITLQNNQLVYGNGQTLSFTNPVTGEVVVIGTGNAGTTPTLSITGAGNAGITLAQSNTLTGFNIATAASSIGVRDGNGTVGTLTVTDVDVTGSGMAVDIDQGGTLNATFDVLSGSGVQLAGSGLSGTFTGTTGTLSASSGVAFQVGDGAGTANTGGTVAISYGGTVTASGAARTVEIQDRASSAGTVTFSGAVNHTGGGGGAGIFIDDVAAGNITFSGSSSLNTGAAVAVQVTDVTGGTVLFSGNLTVTTSGAGGILLQNNSVATNFTGGAVSVTSSGGTGVNIANNSGAVTFNNSGAGLDISTTTGTGLAASSSGVLLILGSGNSISATTGVGLNVANTTIGAGGLNFVSIGANGAANGIVLNNTGATGSLTVTGTGTANSGGTISGTSGDGVDVSSGRFNLGYMLIQNPAGNGIDALNLLGSNSFTNGTITGFDSGGSNTENGVYWVGTGATAGTLTITNVTFSGGNAGNDGILMESQGSGNMTLTVDNATFTGLFGDGVQVNGTMGATATMRVTIQNSDFIDAIATTGNGGISLNPFGDVNFIADINNNLLEDIIDHVVTIGAIGVTNGSTADADITIRNNVINSNLGGRGITITADGGTTDLLIDNNSVDRMGTNSSYAIVTNFIGPATGNVTISNNDIGQAAPLWTSDGLGGAIWLNAQAGSTMTAALSNNVIDVNTASVIEAVWLRSIGGSTLNATLTGNDIDDTAGTSVELNVQAGLSTTQAGTVNLNMSGNNLNAGGLTLTENQLGSMNVTQSSSATLSSGNGSPTVTAAGSQATPTYGAGAPPTPSLPSLPLWTTQVANPDGAGTLTAAQLEPVVDAAIQRWLATGLTDAQKAALANLVVGIADLNEGFVAATGGSLVLLDIDAAGHGWYVDATPFDDFEFAGRDASGGLVALDGEASARMDLLTAVMHEIGHVLGLGDAYDDASAGEVMHGYIEVGERHLPEATLVGAGLLDRP